jgi:hypothetical protein
LNYHTKIANPSVEQFQKGYAKSIATAIENDSNEIAIIVNDEASLSRRRSVTIRSTPGARIAAITIPPQPPPMFVYE